MWEFHAKQIVNKTTKGNNEKHTNVLKSVSLYRFFLCSKKQYILVGLAFLFTKER